MADNELAFLKASSKARAVLQTGPAVTVTFQPYQYAQLETNQIRVLSVSVEPVTGFFVCNFHVRDLAASQGAYRAISYCWGDPKPTHRVLCSDGKSLLVTESAAEILKFIVPRNPMDFFWIDQLCINQTDLVEKSAQVLVMGQIYSFTKQVIAWMGRGGRSCKRAITFVETLFSKMEEMERKGLQPTVVPLMSLAARVHNIPAWLKAERQWSALSHLLRNPWFERIWVMQEVIMACTKTSHSARMKSPVLLSFEKYSVDFDLLVKVLKVIENDHFDSELAYKPQDKNCVGELDILPPGYNAIKTFSTFRESRSRGTSIQFDSALSHSWHFKASNNRDKVYAVMAFADEALNANLRPNYEWTVENVYTAWATALLERNGHYPMLLHMAGIGHQRSLPALPSWVPDFSSGSFEGRLGSEMRKGVKEGHYLASGTNGRNEIGVDRSSLTLRFRGIRIDTVGAVWMQPSSGMGNRWYRSLKLSQDKKFYRSILQWITDIESFLEKHSPDLRPDESQSRDILWQTFIGDYPSSKVPIDSRLSQAFKCWYQAQRELAGKHMSSWLPSMLRQPDFYNQAQTFDDLKTGSMHDRPVFGIPQRGLIGHAPKGLQLGDTVCIVKGARTPFLLRPDTHDVESDNLGIKRWRLVGGCFVHGLMYGEGLSMGKLEDFVII